MWFDRLVAPPGVNALGIAVASVACLLLVSGCDSGPPTAPVHGTITYKGKPVTTGTITFYPAEGGRPAVGDIGSDGSYTLSRTVPGDNVILGDYKVAIEATESSATAPPPTSLADELSSGPASTPPPKQLVPAKYSTIESSELTATVTEGDNTIDFPLE